MQTGTLLLILLAAIVALAIVLFQYYHPVKKRAKIHILLSFLRFLTWFGVFLLLINPEFSKYEYELEKTKLLVLTDNSSSIASINGQNEVATLVEKITEDETLPEKYSIKSYSFGEALKISDSLNFTEKNTNIHKALHTLKEAYANTNTVTLLFSDGNATFGEDYRFFGKDQNFPVYPVVLGDTTRYEDIYIGQINHNKYAFLKNKFPIEAYINYEGSGVVSSRFTIQMDGKVVYSEIVELNSNSNSKTISTLLNATSVGVKTVTLNLSPLEGERNTINNTKNIGIEVIDEKTKIAIISNLAHPDLGALIKSIETNEQRSVSVVKPSIPLQQLDDFDLFILYQPTGSFNRVYEYLKNRSASKFTITGSKTDWRFLNRVQYGFTKNNFAQEEEIAPILNNAFTIFSLDNFSPSNFPPLESDLGEILIPKPHEVVLYQSIKGVTLNEPLLAVITEPQAKEVVLFGENLWKWRIQSYREYQNFENFDALISKLILYLSSNKPKGRLLLDYETLYTGNVDTKIKATYFDEAFIFDPSATLTIALRTKSGDFSNTLPMVLKNGFYAIDLSDVPAGDYVFTVQVVDKPISASGSFTILDFDVEKQLLSSDYKRLEALAKNTDGKLYYPDNIAGVIRDLQNNSRFAPTQKSKQNVVALVDFKFILGIIVLALGVEWFIRKYHGLL